MEYFGSGQVLMKTANADDYHKAQTLPVLMGRSYLSSNSFRGRVLQAPVDDCSGDPFAHGNVDRYLRNIGAGKFWPMPKIVNEAKAKELTDYWRKRAQEAYKYFAPIAIHFSELFYEHFREMAETKQRRKKYKSDKGAKDDNAGEGPSDYDGEKELPLNLRDLVDDAWDAVMNMEEFQKLFGPEAKIPEYAGSGFGAWADAFQRLEQHRSTAVIGRETLETQVPVAVYKFTPPTEEIDPDFTDYEQHCRDNKLAYLIPWLNMGELISPKRLRTMLMRRAMHPPPTFARSDWDAMQLGRCGRLLMEPYCDACFLDFDQPQGSHAAVPKSDDVTGAKFHGVFISHPSAKNILGNHSKAQSRGQIFGWGDGLLILQAQATILRFCAEVTRLMVKCHVTDKNGQARPGLNVLVDTPKFLPLHFNFPLRFEIPGVAVSKKPYKAALEKFKQIGYPLPTNIETQFPEWFYFQELLMDSTFFHNTIYRSEVKIDSLTFQHIGPKMNPKLLELLVWSYSPLATMCTMKNSTRTFCGMLGAFLTNHWGRVPAAGNKQQLAHFTSTNIAAKRLLANDVIRRLLRHIIFGIQLRSDWTNLIAAYLGKLPAAAAAAAAAIGPPPQLEEVLPVLRTFAETSWTMLRGQGFFHGTKVVAELCERDDTNTDFNDSMKLPDGLTQGTVPDSIRFVGSKTGPGDDDSAQKDGDVFEYFFKLFELGPPDVAHGFPSMELLVQKMLQEFEALRKQIDGDSSKMSYSMFLLDQLCDLARMTNQLSLLERRANVDVERAVLYVRRKEVDELLQRSASVNLMKRFDNFDFENHISGATLEAVYNRVLGLRDPNEPEIPTTESEAAMLVQKLLEEVENWLTRDDPTLLEAYKGLMDEFNKVASVVLLTPNKPWKYDLDWGRMPNQRPGSAGSGTMEIDPSEAGDAPDARAPEAMDVDQTDDIEGDVAEPNAVPAGNVAPGTTPMNEDLEVRYKPTLMRFKSTRLPSPNRNHEDPGKKGKKKDTGKANADNEDAEGEGSGKLPSKHLDTAETLLKNDGTKTGSISAQSVKKLFGRLGFIVEQNAEGSRVCLTWTTASRLPKPNGSATHTIHIPHGQGQGHSLEKRNIQYMRKDLKDWGITWNVFKRHYMDDGGKAMMVRVLGQSSSEDEGWSGSEAESEEEELDSPATEVLEPVKVNGVGKRRRKETEDEDEDELCGTKRIRPIR